MDKDEIHQAIDELFTDGLIEFKRDEAGEVVYRNGRPVYVATVVKAGEEA